MTDTPCPRCQQATTDGLLCHPCTQLYHRARKDLTRFTPELRTAWLCLDQVARGTRHGDDHTLELAAVEAEEAAAVPAMLRTRQGQIALVATALPVNLDAGRLYRQAQAWLGWIPSDPQRLRAMEDAAEVVDHTRRLAHRVEEAIDRREPELYLGTCDAPDVHLNDAGEEELVTLNVCGVHLYARAGDVTITCQACGYEYKIRDRRDRMLTEVRNLLERPKVIADALTSLDMPVTAKTLDDWIYRDKKLHEQGRARRDGLPLILADPVYDDDGKPLYLVGAVIDRIEAMRGRRTQERTAP